MQPLLAIAEQPQPKLTMCDRLAQFFEQHQGEWVDGMVLAKIAGQYAWRSRVSDLRKRGYVIENRQRPVQHTPPFGQQPYTITVSEYRLVKG